MQRDTIDARHGGQTWGIRRAPAMIAALSLGLLAALVWSLAGLPARQGNAAPAASPAPAVAVGETPRPTISPDTGSKRVNRPAVRVVLPADGDYLMSRTIPVAGLAYGRPHGSGVSAVEIRIYSDGKLLSEASMPVHSGRFAGVIQLDDRAFGPTLELRISAVGRSTSPPAVLHVKVLKAGAS
jgi:hypothetical protein